jgi:hypothetical protein
MKTRLIGFAAQAESEGTRASSQKKRAMFMAEERLPKNELTLLDRSAALQSRVQAREDSPEIELAVLAHH